MKFKRLKFSAKNDGDYLLPSDIDDILNDFYEMENHIKAQENKVPQEYINLMISISTEAIQARVNDIIRRRKTEHMTEIATSAARDYEQTPRYYRPWWRLFMRTPNKAMQLINDREEQIARLIHLQQQIENDELEREADEKEEDYKNNPGDENSEEESDEETIATLPQRKSRDKSTSDNEENS